MSILKGLQEYGKITMLITIIVCIIILIITVIGLIYVNFFFEKGYVSKSVIIDSNPICIPPKNANDYTISGTMMVSFYYNNKEYKLPVKLHDNCYIYTKGSKVDVIFNPNDISGTISIKSNDFKWTFNIILIIFGIAAILTLIYNYYLINNKTAETVAAGSNIANSIRNLF